MLRFHHYGSNLWWLMDDVRVLASSTCAPAAPADVLAVSGNAEATVSFTAPSSGGSPITGYTVTSNPAGGADQDAGTTALSHLVTGLSNGTVYTFTVEAANALGTSLASDGIQQRASGIAALREFRRRHAARPPVRLAVGGDQRHGRGVEHECFVVPPLDHPAQRVGGCFLQLLDGRLR